MEIPCQYALTDYADAWDCRGSELSNEKHPKRLMYFMIGSRVTAISPFLIAEKVCTRHSAGPLCLRVVCLLQGDGWPFTKWGG